MSKQFWIFLIAGIAIVGVALLLVLQENKGSHLELTGQILKIRVLSLNPKASLVTTDFRVNNPSDIPFVVRLVTLTLERNSGEPLEGVIVSKSDMDTVFNYNKLLGPKFNDVLSVKDRINPHIHVDRMVGARFELPEAEIDARKTMRLHIEEIDGVTADITEKEVTKK